MLIFMVKYNVLREAGLNENECKIYQRLLEYGELTPPKLAILTGLTRQNTYMVLKSLAQKDLIEEFEKQKKLTYRPQHPQKLVDFVSAKKREGEMAEEAIKANLPILANLYNLSNYKPSISYFEGMEGIKTIHEEALRSKPEEIMVFQSIYDQQRLGRYLESYVRRRGDKGIRARMISPRKGAKGEIENEPHLNRMTKYIPDGLFQTSAEISFSDNLVAFITYQKKIGGFVITSKEVSKTLRVIFEMVWAADYSNVQRPSSII